MASNTATTGGHNSICPPTTDHPQQRPPMQSHLSNSVPSTPYQHPRDLRFPPSRSPSPRRVLGSHSPRSVVSEAIEPTVTNGVPRPLIATPVVCKFETGPEWRKRRIPYVDGGDQELAPPEKRPRAALDPVEEDKLSGDMRELYDRLLPSEKSEQNRALLAKKLERIFNDEWPGHDIGVSVFGSSGNLLSSNDSDVDICVTTSLKKVESMHNLAMLLDRHGMERVVCRSAAKVPIVKCWDPELELACDVNVNNPLALENTRMIKTYVQLDSRVRPLAKVVKHWTKERILNDAAFGGTISSYTWICMVISFLQQRQPPILPSLQKSDGLRSTVDGRISEFADDVDALKGCGDANKESLGALLFEFFRYYGYEFEYPRLVISVKEGRKVSRTEKGWDNPRDNKEARCRLCVEEPFNTSRNLGNSADDYAWSGIHGEIRRAFDLLADGTSLEKCCERFIFPPEEKSVFQRPAPKPKPTLTRSASQSGTRPSQESHTTRSRKGSNRNQSSHRSGSRRASSGAVFGNQRIPMLQSPQLGLTASDHFSKQGNLHDQLFQQYQYLQAQQDVLRNQLVMREQQQQAQGHASGASSPHVRQHPFMNGRLFDTGAQTALLPGTLYHYTPRYPPPSPALAQHSQRSRDGSITNPSSPSLTNAMPAAMRQGHRASTVDGSSSTIRSQSQPGRSLPHPLTLQQQVYPGYDVSGALGPAYPRHPQFYAPGVPGGYSIPVSPLAAFYPGVDPTAPKEYIGYYVGQSPQLGPHYVAAANQIPPMQALSNPPQRQRRVTPDLPPSIANGQAANSRSASPLRRSRSRSTAVENRSTPTSALSAEFEGPLIVNGSTPLPVTKSRERVNGFQITNGENALGLELQPPPLAQTLPLRTDRTLDAASDRERTGLKSTNRTSPHLTLSPNGTPPNGLDTSQIDMAAMTAPLLSPVAELRTPSPTLTSRFDGQDWPQMMNGIDKHAKIANAKLVEENKQPIPQSPVRTPKTNSERDSSIASLVAAQLKLPSSPTPPQHARKGSVPSLATAPTKQNQSPTLPTPLSAGLPSQVDKSVWQQAISRKGHKKNKSLANAASLQRSPVIEAERKGG